MMQIANQVLKSLEELIDTTGQVKYEQCKLGVKALEHRLTLTVKNHNGNVAVVEFLNESGKLETKAFSTLTEEELASLGRIDKSHAEQLAFDWLKEKGIKNIKAIYSELEPCSLRRVNCKAEISKRFPDAKVSYTFPFSNIGEVMSKAKIDKAKALSKFIKIK